VSAAVKGKKAASKKAAPRKGAAKKAAPKKAGVKKAAPKKQAAVAKPRQMENLMSGAEVRRKFTISFGP
jgi:hypothetical protein